MSPRLVVRADAGPQLGTGHLMRCLALAEAWRDGGGVATFLGSWEPAAAARHVRDAGFDCRPILRPHPHPGDLVATLEALGTASGSWVAVDGYHFDIPYQRAIRAAGHRLLLLADGAEHPDCEPDLLLDAAAEAVDVPHACPSGTVRLLGTRYVLLRREVLAAADSRAARSRNGESRLLITLGGGEGGDLLATVLAAVALLRPRPLVRLVIGPSADAGEAARAVAIEGCEVLVDPPSLVDQMTWADVAVSAAGGTAWELAHLGVPSLFLVRAPNQRGVATALAATGAPIVWEADGARPSTLASLLAPMLHDAGERLSLGERLRGLVDGGGAGRVVTAMIGLTRGERDGLV